MSVVVNGPQFNAGLDGYVDRFEKMFRSKVRMLVSEGMRRLIAKTPVNTGQAVRSYVASSGAPQRKVGAARAPVEATNKLAIGAEQLRGGAEAEAIGTLSGVDFSNPYNTFWITNAAPHIAGLEYGMLPAAPYTPRSPAGMFGVTVEELMLLLNSGRI